MRVPRCNKEGYADPTAQFALKRCPAKNKKTWNPSYRPIVFICSPYAGDTERNVKNAIRYCKYALTQNKFPFAPHLQFPQFLDDRIPEERELGLKYGRIYLRDCKEVWVFGTYFSRGMEAEIAFAKRWKIPVRFFTDTYQEVTEYEARHWQQPNGQALAKL